MAATFGGGGGSSGDLPFVHIEDTTPSQGTGAVSAGIGLTGPDGPVPGFKRIGAPATDVAEVEFVNTP